MRNHSVPLKLGSGPNGQPLTRWTCARGTDQIQRIDPCLNDGKQLCAKCRQVKYCSKECQISHWKVHKKDCNSSYASDNWVPAWMKESRQPTFMQLDDGPIQHTAFGAGPHYLWGNIPAYDCLNLPANEGMGTSKHKDFTLCFSASGDLRNIVKTINGLPIDYEGTCTIVLNDFHPQVTARNLILLCMMLDATSANCEEVVEAVLHLSYSAAVTKAHSDHAKRCVDRVLASNENHDIPEWASGTIRNDSSILEYRYIHSNTLNLAQRLVSTSYSWKEAKHRMHQVTMAPARVDYRDRYLCTLKPRHRSAFMKWREDCVLLPFGQPLQSFTEPNRLLFSPNGEWILFDNSSPAVSWSCVDADRTRQRMGLPNEDFMGGVFFHVKEELLKFIHRLQNFKLRFWVFSIDMLKLPELMNFVLELRFYYDRIETSNVMDTIPAKTIVETWGPLLNKKNPHSALLLHSMNWTQHVPSGSPDSLGEAGTKKLMREMAAYPGLGLQSLKSNPMAMTVFTFAMMNDRAAFFDSSSAFKDFIGKVGFPKACKSLNLCMRKKLKVHPMRYGVDLNDSEGTKITVAFDDFYMTGRLSMVTWAERFFEIEAKGGFIIQEE